MAPHGALKPLDIETLTPQVIGFIRAYVWQLHRGGEPKPQPEQGDASLQHAALRLAQVIVRLFREPAQRTQLIAELGEYLRESGQVSATSEALRLLIAECFSAPAAKTPAAVAISAASAPVSTPEHAPAHVPIHVHAHMADHEHAVVSTATASATEEVSLSEHEPPKAPAPLPPAESPESPGASESPETANPVEPPGSEESPQEMESQGSKGSKDALPSAADPQIAESDESANP